MLSLSQAVIVEGKYDKIKLSNIIDALIITTDGFRIFKDEDTKQLIKSLAENQGIIVLTDSDSAGFIIRNYINNITKGGKVINVCLPEILGKEKRKTAFSSDGLLGVEGTDDEIILAALKKAGVEQNKTNKEPVTKSMLYFDGFIGTDNCCEKRKKLLELLKIPKSVSSNMLPQIITQVAGIEEYKKAVNILNNKLN
ncbi:MAG: DUF4093 domain-containing protein [Acutalibacteraceae bacterium]|nr:DUF4093 domain-containing protein [Acutalibacteraceae bacterium]